MTSSQAAPDELEMVREFVNTYDIEEGTDALSDAAKATAWCHEKHLLDPRSSLKEKDRQRLTRVREGLRMVLLSHSGATPETGCSTLRALSAELDGIRLRPVIGLGKVTFAPCPDCPTDDILGLLAGTIMVAALEGRWTRLKACLADDCQYAFYDHSRNGSGHWCSMGSCGNRAKARRYRARQRSEAPGAATGEPAAAPETTTERSGTA